MKVQGLEVDPMIEQEALWRMRQPGAFSATDVANMLYVVVAKYMLGIVPPERQVEFTMRCTDRLIQREKKAGNIELHGKRQWKWVGPR